MASSSWLDKEDWNEYYARSQRVMSDSNPWRAWRDSNHEMRPRRGASSCGDQGNDRPEHAQPNAIAYSIQVRTDFAAVERQVAGRKLSGSLLKHADGCE